VTYTTVFDISAQPFQWWIPAIGLWIFAIGVILIWFVGKWPDNVKIVGGVMAVLGLFFAIVVYNSMRSMWSDWKSEYRNGHYSWVEGIVEDFRPEKFPDQRQECFRVQTQRFCYSYFINQPGFHQSADRGGPIHEGLPVRIAFLDDQILRLDVRSENLTQ
jgi:hypothetical protein